MVNSSGNTERERAIGASDALHSLSGLSGCYYTVSESESDPKLCRRRSHRVCRTATWMYFYIIQGLVDFVQPEALKCLNTRIPEHLDTRIYRIDQGVEMPRYGYHIDPPLAVIPAALAELAADTFQTTLREPTRLSKDGVPDLADQDAYLAALAADRPLWGMVHASMLT